MTTECLDHIKIFADGAVLDDILELRQCAVIRGFTTNPTLMRTAGVADYESFAIDFLEHVWDLPISFEVFSDDPLEMERQAMKIASWGENVYVKIPVTDTSGASTAGVQRRLSDAGVKINVTALMTVAQVEHVVQNLAPDVPASVSVFAGRIADTGRDPFPVMAEAVAILKDHPAVELIWASTRELFNVVQAASVGCHIITLTHDLLRKLHMLGWSLDAYSLDTVRMFHRDAREAGYSL